MGSAKPFSSPVVGLLLAAFYGHCAFAEVRVQGPAENVRVDARGATVAEILTALDEHYAVRYRGALIDGGVTATFEGPLRRVLARLLTGNDYVIKRGGDGLDVILLSPGATSRPASSSTGAVINR
jgi:hypothetical protein